MKFLNQFKAGRQIQKLKTSRSQIPEAVEAVVEQLVRMGPSAVEPVLECLSHGEAREPALEVLDRLLTDETLDHYLEALRSPNPAVVSGVTKILSSAKSYDVSRILDLLWDKSFSKATLESLLGEQLDRISPRRLVGLIPELGKDARAVVFRLLEKTPDETITSDMVRLLDHEDWSVRLNAGKVLGQSGSPSGIDGLFHLLKDEHKSVRLEGVLSIHRLRAKNSVPHLTKLLRDKDIKVQAAAIDALVDIADASAVTHLLDVLKDESEYSRRAAVEVLNEVATTEAIQDLVRALRDADWWVRVRAADALGSLGGNKVVDGVVTLLQDPDDFIRRYAVEILNAVTSKRAVGPLIQALQDPDWWVRERSIDALAKTGNPRAVEPLIELLHQDIEAAPHCVRALGVIGDLKALGSLIPLVESENAEIKAEAGDALLIFSRMELGEEDTARVRSALAKTKLGGGRNALSGTKSMSAFGPESVVKPLSVSAPIPPTPGPPPADQKDQQPAAQAEGSSTQSINFHKLSRGDVVLERFRIIRLIGKGGFGSIYLVEDAAIQEEMILKVLNPQLSVDEGAIKRFVQELKLTRSITHQNVIRIFDFLDLGGARAVSMEYFPGRDLGKILRSEGVIDYERGLRIVAQICDGLQAAHTAGVIHRDIKPANILVGSDGKVKVVDFGLASVEQGMGSRLTKSGILIGTPEYMAPEQIADKEVDFRADIYSLGILMYEMFSNQKPFSGETPVKTLFMHLETEAKPLSEIIKNFHPPLEDLIKECMSKDPDDRPTTPDSILPRVEAMLAELAEAA